MIRTSRNRLRALPAALLTALLCACAHDAGLPDGFVSCGAPGCSLAVADTSGVSLRARGRERRLVHDATGAAVEIEVFRGEEATQLADARGNAIASSMAPRVAWTQDDAQSNGFAVSGFSGMTRSSGLLAPTERQWFARFANPRTGSVLLLHLRAPTSDWDAAWADLEPIITRVRLAPVF